MSYSYENLAIDKTKVNCVQKCFYLINLIKAKSLKKWEELRPHYEMMKPDESYDFYEFLIQEYKSLITCSGTVAKKKAVKKASPPKKKAPAKKAPAKKKAAKKPSKKK